ncbi:MAG: AI-2E family transporter [Slackia sp.]|nr:AI-2E family transporter [Slackia sp.]
MRRSVFLLATAAFFAFLAAIGVMYSRQLFAGASAVWAAFFPLVLGCVIAFLVNLIMGRLERVYFPSAKLGPIASSRRPVCMAASFAIIAAVIAIIVNLILPELKASAGVIQQGVALVLQDLYRWAQDDLSLVLASLDSASLENLERSIADFMAGVSSGDSSSVMNMLKSVFSTATSIAHNVFSFIVAIVFSLYLLLDKDRVFKGLNTLLDLAVPARFASSIRHAGRVANQAFSRFITGQCIEAVILGTLCAIGMGIFGMPYAVAVGATVGLTALVPVFGAWLGGAIGFLMILTVNPMQAVWFIVFLVVLQQLESHLIYPNVVGASVGLPGIWVFGAVLVGGALFGVLGMFLGVPTVATLRTLAMDRAAKVRERRARAAEQEHERDEQACAEKSRVQRSVGALDGEIAKNSDDGC